MLREDLELRQAREDRKTIERAKGVVAKRLRIDKLDTYQSLHRLSSTRNLKLPEVALLVQGAEEVFWGRSYLHILSAVCTLLRGRKGNRCTQLGKGFCA